MESLDTTQKDKLRQFQEITNIQDPEIAVGTLASLDWNLERAIETHLLNDSEVNDDDDGQNIRPVEVVARSPFSDRSGRPQSLSERVQEFMEQIEGEEDSSFNNEEEVTAIRVLPPIRATNPSSSSSSAHPIVDSDDEVIFDDDEATHNADAAPRVSQARSNGDIPLIPQDSNSVMESLHNFVTVFESRYCNRGGAFMPLFHIDSLSNTIREAFEAPDRPVSERKPLAIYIHNDKSVAANIFATNVMCKDEISHLLRHQFVLWGWDVTFRENQQKLFDWLKLLNIPDSRAFIEAMHYSRDRYPLLILLTKEKGTLKMVDVCDGTDAPAQVIEKLLNCVEEYTTIRMNELQEQREREEREQIRQEQAEEYEKSLAADRARRKAKEQEIREQQEEEERRIRAEEEEKLRRARLESELPDEPAEDAPDAIMVKFRVPEGEQFVRRFRSSDSLNVLMNFLSSKGFSKDQYRFFNSDFPKKEISTWDATSTFTTLKWPRREQIFVEEQ